MKKFLLGMFAIGMAIFIGVGVSSCGDDEGGDQKDKNAFGSKIKRININGVEFNMILVEGGSFQMGATQEQVLSGEKIDDFEFPVHKVTLSSYYLAETEVTNELYNAVMGTNNERLYHPVCGTWDSFYEFIQRLNEMSGKKFRFPTEAEWEFAARGGKKSQGHVFSGSDIKDAVGWYYCNSGEGYLAEVNWNWWTMTGNGCDTHVVATRMPNELGFYDMSGNLYEWCSDWYADYTKEDQVNPKGPETGYYKCCKGGSYAHFSTEGRCSHRRGSPLDEEVYWGLRLAMDK